MKPASFKYHQPRSLQELVGLLDQYQDSAKVIAGGQSLAPMMNMRMAYIEELIDINQLKELSFIQKVSESVQIGAMTRHHQVANSDVVKTHCPLLSNAANTIGHYVIRQRGTIGGSLCHADPVAQMPLIALTLGATFEARSSAGVRSIQAPDFFLGAMTTSLLENEFLQSITYPSFSNSSAWSFEIFNRRHGDYAIVSVALCVEFGENQNIQGIRIGLNGVSAFAQDYSAFCKTHLHQPFSENWLEDLSEHLLTKFTPFDEQRISARYRLEIAKHLIKKAFYRAHHLYLSNRN